MSKIDLELAGFVDSLGQLGRPVPSGQVIVPGHVWLERDAIRWRMGSAPRLQEVSPNMLNRFTSLRDEESILRFAKSSGVLALQAAEAGSALRRPDRERKDEGCEPIAAWLYFARRAAAVLNIAAALKQDKLGDLADWEQFGMLVEPGDVETAKKAFPGAVAQHKFGLGWHVLVQHATHEDKVANAREVLAAEISAWLDCWKRGRQGGISDFALQWSPAKQRWELRIDFHGLLFAAIAFQLALVVAEAESLYSCSGCGNPYIRARERKRPKRGWANYCDACAEKGIGKRRAVESYREKKTDAVRMRQSGVTIADIAAQLHTDVSRVKRWLQK